MGEWSQDDYQGRSEQQVERNNKIFMYTMKTIIITILITLLMSLFSCKTKKNSNCDAYSNLEENKTKINYKK
jgi:heme/copper-type cytochrome/quinol oxidase subunit 2